MFYQGEADRRQESVSADRTVRRHLGTVDTPVEFVWETNLERRDVGAVFDIDTGNHIMEPSVKTTRRLSHQGVFNVLSRSVRKRRIDDKVLISSGILHAETDRIDQREQLRTGACKIQTCILIINFRLRAVGIRHAGVIHLDACELQFSVIDFIRGCASESLPDGIDFVERPVQIRHSAGRKKLLPESGLINYRPGIHIVIKVQDGNPLGAVSEN